jgi:hypothetical protein
LTLLLSDSDSETPAKIASEHPTLSLSLDTISEKGTTVSIAKAFSSGKGHVVTLLPVKDEALSGFKDVNVEPTLVCAFSFSSFRASDADTSYSITDTVLGKAFSMGIDFPEMPEDKKAIEEWCASFFSPLFSRFLTLLPSTGLLDPTPSSSPLASSSQTRSCTRRAGSRR